MSSQLTSLSEIQDLVEEFSRVLLEVDRAVREGAAPDPDHINACFRIVHTVKGISSMVEVSSLVQLSHALEGYLDELRLGRRPLERGTLDVLFEAVDVYGGILGHAANPNVPEPGVDGFLATMGGDLVTSEPQVPAQSPLGWLDEGVLSVLTEYEEHRLRENISAGRTIFAVHASFDLMEVDVGVERLKGILKDQGEVLTYLPSADAIREDMIDLDILVGSDQSIDAMRAALASESVSIDRLHADGQVVTGDGEARAASAPPPASALPSPSVPLQRRDEDSPRGPRTREPDTRPHGAAPAVDAPEVVSRSIRSVVQTVRVELSRLDALMNLVGELRVLQGDVARGLDGRDGGLTAIQQRELRVQTRQMARKIDALRDRILDVRMVPVGQMFDALARVVRKISREHGKDVRLTVSGEQTELDKLIVEELSDPLMHMIRNAIDHGIETVEERSALGKPLTGRVGLHARQRGNSVEITVEDDGRGMRWSDIRTKAVARGLVPREAAEMMTPKEALRLIFTPGFSTLDQVSELSGRGVGMDVVKTNIMRLSGLIDVESTPGAGTTFSLTLPVTLAIIQALVIKVGSQTFCVPLGSVMESLMLDRADVETVEGFEVANLRSETLPLVHLDRFFDLSPGPAREELYVIVVGLAQHRVGLIVDDLLEQKDVVIKPLGPGLDVVPGLAGATEIGAGQTVLLLDLATILAEAVQGFASGDLRARPEARP